MESSSLLQKIQDYISLPPLKRSEKAFIEVYSDICKQIIIKTDENFEKIANKFATLLDSDHNRTLVKSECIALQVDLLNSKISQAIRKVTLDHLIKLTEKRSLPDVLITNLLQLPILSKLIALHKQESLN